MFDKVLIANRGAIAVRIIRTLKRMGVTTVAIYAQSDSDSPHVRRADEAYSLGEGSARETYLDIDKVLTIAQRCGAQAIHPGYGFLSENAIFVERCEAASIQFIGPTAEQIRGFGLKHEARRLAEQAQLPLLPGTGLLNSEAAALEAAEELGYPVMLKSTAGGGGIGMGLCHDADALSRSFDSIQRLGANNFANDGVFLEKFVARARHVEVQVIGDGQGQVVAFGERDCSSQRRNQKVIEECPAPGLSDALRQSFQDTACRLLAQIQYRNAGTVEFILDADSDQFFFLEVNTRLQVEHGVTEVVWGIDLVDLMLQVAAGNTGVLMDTAAAASPQGHAWQARIYAEDPHQGFQPSAGLLSDVCFATLPGLRVDTWVESGITVSPWFDPMLAKVIASGQDRESARRLLHSGLSASHLYGIVTNLDYLTALIDDPALVEGSMTTRYLDTFECPTKRMEVISAGTLTTVQDYPGRQGYWHVGVPPSGPFDSVSFRLGNRLLNNESDAAGLEISLSGPSLRFTIDCDFVVTGAELPCTLDGIDVPLWHRHIARAGQVLSLGRIADVGARAYLSVSGGIQCPHYLGSRSTFTLGQFGGHGGRALRTGDVLKLSPGQSADAQIPVALRPPIAHHWSLRVISGPHGAPDFFTEADLAQFVNHRWEVHYNSSRTGVRLLGPKPEWARTDGGEAGMHPSNIHDNAYAFGTVDFTGDMPVILGPDGPSLGGFVCPATVITADLWKLGQLKAGDTVVFEPVSLERAVALETLQLQSIAELNPASDAGTPGESGVSGVSGVSAQGFALPSAIQHHLPSTSSDIIASPGVTFRRAGDHFMLVEYGQAQLDLRIRFRIHTLMQWLQQHTLPGLRELTPGVRSLQIHYDSQRLSATQLMDHLLVAESALSDTLEATDVSSRIVHLPLAWDDAVCQQAADRYTQSVRGDAPWCPHNIEFIRRINGLDSIDAVRRIVFDASYLVMGLGDVYLGAPVATPVDPRHRLVTTKYNPARTWTAENSVGIGGAYLCVYGMEGPGGYQLLGRTLQMWNRYQQTSDFEQPWLLRFFDQIRFHPVSPEELLRIRRDFPTGQYQLDIEHQSFNLGDYQQFLDQEQNSIARFQSRRQQAFDAELARWHANDQFHFTPHEGPRPETAASLPEGQMALEADVSGALWKTLVKAGDILAPGDTVMILESMKMEIPVCTPCQCEVKQLLASDGDRIQAGDPLVVYQELS